LLVSSENLRQNRRNCSLSAASNSDALFSQVVRKLGQGYFERRSTKVYYKRLGELGMENELLHERVVA
jgi:hypothetical protein